MRLGIVMTVGLCYCRACSEAYDLSGDTVDPDMYVLTVCDWCGEAMVEKDEGTTEQVQEVAA